MKITDAQIPDADAIYALITSHAELDKMLFRSIAYIYENLQLFTVARPDQADSPDDTSVVGCCALQVVWSDLAEIKSLAVTQPHLGKGIGSALVQAVLEKARRLGVPKVFTLTLEPEFFEKLGFERIDKKALPMKVWTDCAKCSKQEDCDEIALIRTL